MMQCYMYKVLQRKKTTVTMVFHLTESSSETDPGLVELITVKRRIKNTIRNVFQTVWSI